VGVAHRFDVFALENDRQFVVHFGVIIRSRGVEVQRVLATADGAVPLGRVKTRGGRGLGFSASVDHRHDDAVRPVVQYTLDVIVAIRGHAGQGATARVGDGPEDQRGGFDVRHAVFHVHIQPVEAGTGQEAG